MTNSPCASNDWSDALQRLQGHELSLGLSNGERLRGELIEVLADRAVIRPLEAEVAEVWVRISAIVSLARPTLSPASTAAPVASPVSISPPRPEVPCDEGVRNLAALRPKIVTKPVFAPNIEVKIPSAVDSSRWHERVAAADAELFTRLRAETLHPLEGAYAAARGQLEGLIERHPVASELHILFGQLAWTYGRYSDACRGFFAAAALGESRHWRDYAQACLADDETERALLGLEEYFARHALEPGEQAWQDLLTLCDWHGDYAALVRVAGAAEQRGWPDELAEIEQGLAQLEGVSLSGSGLVAWREALRCLCARGEGTTRRMTLLREEFLQNIERTRAETRFADIEEDITGVLADAEDLFLHGKMNSAFDAINQAYSLVPGHARARALEERLRATDNRVEGSYDSSRLESSINLILARHELLVLDTSVLSMPDHLNRVEMKRDKVLRESGRHGVATLEERVSYHKLFERLAEQHPNRIIAPEGVLTEVEDGVSGMRDRGALKTFGKSAEALRRQLAANLRQMGFDEHRERQMQTVKATFPRLRKAGLSNVDYDLICLAFVMAIEKKVALLSNDRGIHKGVAEIRSTHSKGNRNIAFLVPAQLEVYTSIHRSHFELVADA